MPRTPIVAANWKMNPPPAGWDTPDGAYRSRDGIDVVIIPSPVDIPMVLNMGLRTGAPFGRPEASGSFTGDISMGMIADHGCQYVLCGHSERRQHHHESDAFVAAQVGAALEAGLTPILCIGETADEREMGEEKSVIEYQLSHTLSVKTQNFASLVLAYEPVWAIGSGKTATAEDAQSMHAFIRSLLPANVRDGMRILYGGSVNASNAPELIAQPDIDGFLVGACSLKPDEFKQIVDLCQ